MAETAKKTGRWGRFLLIWAAALLVLGLIGCALLYGYLGAYERSRPEPVMDRLMEERTAEDWLNAAGENLDFDVTPFEDGAELYRLWREGLDLSGKLSYRQLRGASDGDRAVFAVRCGAANLCRVELVPGEERLGFGQHDWVLGRVSTGDLTASLSSAQVEITALDGQTVLLNGRTVDESWAAETGLTVEGLNPVEARSDRAPRMTRYRIGPLYGAISVTDGEGRELSPVSAQGTLCYDALPEGRVSVTVSAPEDVTVLVNGAALEASDAARTEAGILAGLEDYTGGRGYETRIYELEGLLFPPELRAMDPDGTELSPVYDREGRVVYLHHSRPDLEEQERAAREFFDCYTGYLSSTFSGVRYDALLRHTLPRTELYTYFETSVDTMYWAIHTNTEFRDLSFDHFYPLGDKCFVCTIRYDAGVSGSTWTDAYSHEDQNTYELVFVRQGEYWLAAAMSSIAA